MSNQSYCGPNRLSQNSRLNNSTNEHDRYKLPAINNGTAVVSNMHSTSMTRPCIPQANNNYSTQFSSLNNTDSNIMNRNNPSNGALAEPTVNNTSKTNCPPRGVASSQTFSPPPPTSGMYSSMQPVPANRSLSSNQFLGLNKTNASNAGLNRTPLINQNNSSPPRPMTSGPGGFNRSSSTRNIINGEKTILRDRQLANEILQKAGIPSNSTPNDCLEVITDVPVTMHDNIICDPNPLCMKKPANNQERYEQSIVFRHLQASRPAIPSPIIIRERCAQPIPPPQPPIVIRQIPPRPSTPPPLLIRECPPPMLDLHEPTIIEREVPLPPPQPRQVIVERLPPPPAKPRSIIVERWLPYEEPADRPCIVEKLVDNEMPPPKNLIIQYEAVKPKIQPQCINEGVSYVDPKQFINDKPNGNVEICYVDQLNNLPDHIKCQLSPEILAAIGIQNGSQSNANNPPYAVHPNPPSFQQQHTRGASASIPPTTPRQSRMVNGCHSTKPSYAQLDHQNMYRPRQQSSNRALSASGAGLSHCYDRYNTNSFARSGSQGFNSFSRAHYNPWATTYQMSYTNKARGMCRAR